MTICSCTGLFKKQFSGDSTVLEATAENTAEHTAAISTKVCNRYIFSITKLVTGIPLTCSLVYTAV